MRRLICAALAVTCAVTAIAAPKVRAAARTLDIYVIDVEGGQSTLIVTPAGESLLIDAGFPGSGTFGAKPADPTEARDAQRVFAAAHDAGIQRIDYLLITHFHADHVGGVNELAQLLPIRAFIDHSAPRPEAEAGVAGTQAIYEAYVRVRDNARHIQPRPGERLPLKGLDVTVVASDGQVLGTPGLGTGRLNPACAGNGTPASEPTENPRSTGVRLTFGKFSFLDVGDLTGDPLFALTCPVDRIGKSDVYLVTHHGGADAADPAMFRTVSPLVAILNNGPRKGGAAETFATLQAMPAIDVWQLHRSLATGAANGPDERTANLDESTSAWIKLSAQSDGSFTVTNGRTGTTRSYHR